MARIETLPRRDKSSIEIKGSQEHKQKPAILPLIFTTINRLSTEHVIPNLRESTTEQRLNFAISTYQELVNTFNQDSDRWTLKLLEASKDGSKARRDFLLKENVFNGGEYLYKPPEVLPGMEITNLNPKLMPTFLRSSVEKLKTIFYHEYTGVKNNLRIPLGGSPYRLNTSSSLLIDDYTKAVIREAKNSNSLPLVADFGPGAGEEIIRLTSAGLSVITYDFQPGYISEKMFRDTFKQSGRKCPEIVNLAIENGIDLSRLDYWQQQETKKPTIFICPEIDFSKENAIPKNLQNRASISVSIFTRHEIPIGNKGFFMQNMALAAKSGVVVADGLPTPEALDNVVLPVSAKAHLPVAGSQAIITYLLCDPPEEVKKHAEKSVPNIKWDVSVMSTPPPPLCYPLELIAIGHKKRVF